MRPLPCSTSNLTINIFSFVFFSLSSDLFNKLQSVSFQMDSSDETVRKSPRSNRKQHNLFSYYNYGLLPSPPNRTLQSQPIRPPPPSHRPPADGRTTPAATSRPPGTSQPPGPADSRSASSPQLVCSRCCFPSARRS